MPVAERHDKPVEKTDKERLEELEKAEKLRYETVGGPAYAGSRLAVKKGEPGPFTGEPVADLRLEGETYKAEKYVGIGPLVVKTERGEIKALSGDYIVYYDNPTDKEAPQFLHVIPWELADILGIGEPAVDPESRRTATSTPPVVKEPVVKEPPYREPPTQSSPPSSRR